MRPFLVSLFQLSNGVNVRELKSRRALALYGSAPGSTTIAYGNTFVPVFTDLH
jgi:hypothetical protein